MDNDDITVDLSNILNNITVSSDLQVGDIYIDTTTMNTNVYTIENSWINIGDITADTIDLSSITTIQPVEFEDTMPTVAKVEDMCNDYPALKKAYENFKTIYKMVHQDWQGKQDAEK
jgi:hypothetical protein